ncbi:MAG TPA: hypothetical protein VE987_19345, partial [Polyangiaceae bacterium]|nr:hypothetical protein [Polyangiaceae bacterium]
MAALRWALLAALLALPVLSPAGAGAQPAAQAQQPAHPAFLPRRQANYAWDRDLLRASFSYRDILSDPGLGKKLSSGLPLVIT